MAHLPQIRALPVVELVRLGFGLVNQVGQIVARLHFMHHHAELSQYRGARRGSSLRHHSLLVPLQDAHGIAQCADPLFARLEIPVCFHWCYSTCGNDSALDCTRPADASRVEGVYGLVQCGRARSGAERLR